ncbi:MAG: lipoyl synthase [Polyangiales bacterium]
MGLHERKPEWLKVRLPSGERHAELTQTFRKLRLHTVCEEARCPNIGECWREGTATIMILGDVCTRGCRFCAVTSGNPRGVVDENEPQHVANALAQMDLAYVVLTMVDRDDLPDGGADHVARTVSGIHARSPELLVETLVGDFAGNTDAIAKVVKEGRPDVYAHNVEVVPSLQRKMRDARCSWERSLMTLRAAREAGAAVTKSSVMVGCGEAPEEVFQTLSELREAGVDVVTIGQYLRPTPKHAPVVRYVDPEEFERYRQFGVELGFLYVASGPLVRSSYRAAEAFLQGKLRGKRVDYSDRYGKRRLEVIS